MLINNLRTQKEGENDMPIQETLQTDYYTVKQFVKEKGFLSESSLRYIIFHADTNGFNKVIKRIGKKILIDFNAFKVWLEEINHTK